MRMNNAMNPSEVVKVSLQAVVDEGSRLDVLVCTLQSLAQIMFIGLQLTCLT